MTDGSGIEILERDLQFSAGYGYYDHRIEQVHDNYPVIGLAP